MNRSVRFHCETYCNVYVFIILTIYFLFDNTLIFRWAVVGEASAPSAMFDTFSNGYKDATLASPQQVVPRQWKSKRLSTNHNQEDRQIKNGHQRGKVWYYWRIVLRDRAHDRRIILSSLLYILQTSTGLFKENSDLHRVIGQWYSWQNRCSQ